MPNFGFLPFFFSFLLRKDANEVSILHPDAIFTLPQSNLVETGQEGVEEGSGTGR